MNRGKRKSGAASPAQAASLPHYIRLVLLLGSWVLGAHDIPNDVTVQAFLKPDGARLQLLVRVPMSTLRDVVFPERADGYLDLGQVEPLLADAARLWISDFIELYAGEERLPAPRLAGLRVALESDRSFTSFESAMGHIA